MVTLPAWIKPGARDGALALVAGGLLPLAFAPFDFYPVVLFSLALLFLLCEKAAAVRGALWLGGLFGLGYFGVGVSWVYVAIHDFGYSSLPVAVLLTLLFVAALAVYPALFAAAAVYLRRRFAFGDTQVLLLLLPGMWLLMEWLRAILFTGFPWLSLGYSQSDAPLAGWAPVLGGYGLGLLLAFSAGVFALALKRRRAIILLLALPLWLAGEGLKFVDWTRPAGAPVSVALVQGNLPQMTKWDASQVKRRLATYAGLTGPLLGQHDLVMWPENAITVFYRDYRERYFAALEGQALAKGTDLLFGVPQRDGDGRRYYTTLTNLGPSGYQVYKKDHLVPFGEYVPFESLLRGLIAFFNLPMSGFSPGGEEQPLLELDGNRAALTICYEDLFPSEALRRLPEATLMINGSNNAWYGDSLAPHQHLQIARMRAMEIGRPVIRATTNGISVLLDHRGRVMVRSAQFEQAVLRGEVQPHTGTTPYVLWGELANLLILLAMAAGAALMARKNRTG